MKQDEYYKLRVGDSLILRETFEHGAHEFRPGCYAVIRGIDEDMTGFNRDFVLVFIVSEHYRFRVRLNGEHVERMFNLSGLRRGIFK